jgi:hypothetical protein
MAEYKIINIVFRGFFRDTKPKKIVPKLSYTHLSAIVG